MTGPSFIPRLTEIEFCAWVTQAEPGDAIEYHRGALALDRLRSMTLSRPECERVDRLADRAFVAAGQGLVHLVQERLGPDRFAYIAIARPKPKAAEASLSALLLEGEPA